MTGGHRTILATLMIGPVPHAPRWLLLALILSAVTGTPAFAQSDTRPFRWAGDPEGGAPYVEANPDNPDQLVGFDVEIADLLARGMGRPAQFVLVGFASIDQSVARGDA